jgi:hypothetical protein
MTTLRDLLRANLVAQVREAQRVLVFEALFLRLQ